MSRTSDIKTTVEFATDVLALVAEDNRQKKTALGIATAARIEGAIVSIRALLHDRDDRRRDEEDHY